MHSLSKVVDPYDQQQMAGSGRLEVEFTNGLAECINGDLIMSGSPDARAK